MKAVWTLGAEPVAEGQVNTPTEKSGSPHPKPDFQMGHDFLSSSFFTVPKDNLVSKGKDGGGAWVQESMNFKFRAQELWTSLSQPRVSDTHTLLGIRTTKNVVFTFKF